MGGGTAHVEVLVHVQIYVFMFMTFKSTHNSINMPIHVCMQAVSDIGTIDTRNVRMLCSPENPDDVVSNLR